MAPRHPSSGTGPGGLQPLWSHGNTSFSLPTPASLCTGNAIHLQNQIREKWQKPPWYTWQNQYAPWRFSQFTSSLNQSFTVRSLLLHALTRSAHSAIFSVRWAFAALLPWKYPRISDRICKSRGGLMLTVVYFLILSTVLIEYRVKCLRIELQ